MSATLANQGINARCSGITDLMQYHHLQMALAAGGRKAR